MFTNPTIQSTFYEFNGTSFGFLSCFGMYSSSNKTYYYVMDNAYSIVNVSNDDWLFISSKNFTYPQSMISIGNSLYMTGQYNVWKLDQDLNILINYYGGRNPRYRRISYNPSISFIYVVAAAPNLYEIQVFNLDLILMRRFSTSPHEPYSIIVSSNQLYVGTTGGIILVYQNEIFINQFNACDGNIYSIMTSILFDQNGYMATSCSYPSNKLYIFSQNGSFTGKSLTMPSFPEYIGFDSKGRFIQISTKQISINN